MYPTCALPHHVSVAAFFGDARIWLRLPQRSFFYRNLFSNMRRGYCLFRRNSAGATYHGGCSWVNLATTLSYTVITTSLPSSLSL